MTDTILNTDRPDEMARESRSGRQSEIRRAALLITLALHALAIWWGMNTGRLAAPSREKLQAIQVFLPPMELPEPASPPAAKPAPAPVPPPVASPVSPSLPPPSAPLTSVVTPAPVLPAAPEAPASSETPASPEAAVSLAPLPTAVASFVAASQPVTNVSGATTSLAATAAVGKFSEAGQSRAKAFGTASSPVQVGSPPGPGLELYKRRLFEHIDAHKIYPASARRRHLEGQVRVAFTIEPGGELSRLQASEGHPQLVEAALQTVRHALPLPLPAGNVTLPFNFSYRMDFRLR